MPTRIGPVQADGTAGCCSHCHDGTAHLQCMECLRLGNEGDSTLFCDANCFKVHWKAEHSHPRPAAQSSPFAAVGQPLASPREPVLRHSASGGLPAFESPAIAFKQRSSGLTGSLSTTARLASSPLNGPHPSFHLRQQQPVPPLYNLQQVQPKLLAVNAPHARQYG